VVQAIVGAPLKPRRPGGSPGVRLIHLVPARAALTSKSGALAASLRARRAASSRSLLAGHAVWVAAEPTIRGVQLQVSRLARPPVTRSRCGGRA
jgi:hypothetical protein